MRNQQDHHQAPRHDRRAADGGVAATRSALPAVHAARHLLLTTFRRDGSPVPTPVWFVPDGDDLWIVTTAGSGKVKRLRADDRVELAACTRLGRPRSAPVRGTARVLGADEAQVQGQALADRYGWQARFFQWQNRRKGLPMTAILVSPDREG